MRQDLINKVMADRIYDTRSYRYVYDSSTNCVRRIRIEYLDTPEGRKATYCSAWRHGGAAAYREECQ